MYRIHMLGSRERTMTTTKLGRKDDREKAFSARGSFGPSNPFALAAMSMSV